MLAEPAASGLRRTASRKCAGNARRPAAHSAVTAIAPAVVAQAGVAGNAPSSSIARPKITNNAAGHMIDVAQVQGQVHAQAVHRVGELAEQQVHLAGAAMP